MFNIGLYFETLDLNKTKVLLNLDLESFVIWTPVFKNDKYDVNYSEAVSAIWSGGWQIASKASRKFSPPPCRGLASFTGGWQQLIH